MSAKLVNGVAILVAMMLLPVSVRSQGNPAKGKDLYAQYCAACHGPTGKGDGAAAAALNPKPADFTNKSHMAGLKDQYLFELVQKGGAAMGKSPLIPPFGSKLKEGEIWDVIAYVRSLAK